MLIELPSFDGKHCLAIVACGEVTTKSKKAIEVLNSKKVYSTTYRTNGKERWALAVFGGGEHGTGDRHFHLEVTSKRPPESEHKELKNNHIGVNEFNNMIKIMIGKRIRVRVSGFFSIEKDTIPEDSIVRPSFYEIGSKGSSIKTVGMEFMFEGTMFPYFGWSMVGEGKKLAAKLSGMVSGKVDEKYITRFLDYIDDVFRVYALGEIPK